MVTDITGATVVSQTTDGSGLYRFDNLRPGDYVVRVTPPAGYAPTPVNEADPDTDDNTDSNIAGAGPVAGTVQSGPATLVAGQEPVTDGDTDATSNLSVDFGFVAFDLALRKTVASVSDTPLVPGASTVTFNLEVINQGNIGATNIVVRDYIDTAMFGAFETALNPGGTTTGDASLSYSWTPVGSEADLQISGELAPGETVFAPVTLRVAAGTTGQQLANYAEIAAADETVTNGAAIDIDSTPDAINDEPGNDLLVDNAIDDDGQIDEDDHDVAYITVDAFDLALIKVVSSVSDTPLIPGASTATFTIEVFNQGDVTATAPITIVDYVQTGFTFDPADNAGWSGSAGDSTTTTTINSDIGPGQSTTVDIVLRLDANTAGQTLRNLAEIQDDGQPAGADIDSTARQQRWQRHGKQSSGQRNRGQRIPGRRRRRPRLCRS